MVDQPLCRTQWPSTIVSYSDHCIVHSGPQPLCRTQRPSTTVSYTMTLNHCIVYSDPQPLYRTQRPSTIVSYTVAPNHCVAHNDSQPWCRRQWPPTIVSNKWEGSPTWIPDGHYFCRQSGMPPVTAYWCIIPYKSRKHPIFRFRFYCKKKKRSREIGDFVESHVLRVACDPSMARTTTPVLHDLMKYVYPFLGAFCSST